MGKKPQLLYVNLERNYNNKGTIRKAIAQYKALQKLFTVEYLEIKSNLSNRWKRAIFFYILFPIYFYRKALVKKGSYIYYRYYPHNLLLNIFMFFMKNKNKIYVEVNTKYKYETKKTNLWFYISNLISENLVYRSSQAVLPVTKDMANYVRTICKNCRIIVLGNGYDPYDNETFLNINYNELKEFILKGKDKIKIIWVGNPFLWHGLDRIISEFAKLENVCLYLVGNKDKIKRLCGSSILEKSNIHLLGERNIEELKYLYENCDFGLGSFGLDRINIKDGASLKVREYLYYGLPVIIGHEDSQLGSCEFVHQYRDVDGLRRFLSISFDREKIKRYARENLSWLTIMRNVFWDGGKSCLRNNEE